MTYDEALKHFGTGRAIGEALRVSGSRVSQCRATGGFSYPMQCVLEKESGGALVTKDRVAKINARWNESVVHQDLEFWSDFFKLVGASPFLMGQTEGRNGKPFRAVFDWLISPGNFVKVIEGNFNA